MTECTYSDDIEQAHNGSPDLRQAFSKPFANARDWRQVNWTGAYLRAHLASTRCVSSAELSGFLTVHFVALPNRTNSQLPTKSDHDPRGAFGSQKMYAPKIT